MILLAAGNSAGATITGSAGSGWQSFPSTLDENGSPYWDSPSWDGSQMNVGYLLSGLVGITPQWWGNSNGSADLNFYFQRQGGLHARMFLAYAGRAGVNEFGWYDLTEPGALHPVFPGGTIPGTEAQLDTSEYFGFYFKTPEGGIDQVYYTQSALNPGRETRHTHFAIFGEDLTPGQQVYWLGMEDLRACGTDNDYQDLIVRIQDTPEPSTLLLLLGGAVLLLCLRLNRLAAVYPRSIRTFTRRPSR
jgi:hypothetical protein